MCCRVEMVENLWRHTINERQSTDGGEVKSSKLWRRTRNVARRMLQGGIQFARGDQGNSLGDYVERTSDWGQKMLDVRKRE
jgi:hypothetical protein